MANVQMDRTYTYTALNAFGVFRLTSAVLLALFVMGCTAKIERSELIGTYVSALPGGSEQIELRADGSFLQHVTFYAPAKTYTSKGTWKFSKQSGHMTFDDNLLAPLDTNGAVKGDIAREPSTVHLMEVGRHLGRIRIYANENFFFTKQG